jgi:probable HAF family extracellular repeat protein
MSLGSDINDAGWIVGESRAEASDFEPERRRAFVCVDGVMYDLNEILPADSPWELAWARAINNSGQVLAYGRHADSERQYFGWVLLDPVVPESVEELIEELIDDVEDLVDDGELNNGRGRSLIAELQVALWFLEFHNGERIAAIRLELFIKKVEQLIAIDQLDATLGSELLVKARAALEMLHEAG